MSRLILGTAGHIDHGKTALVKALTGIDTDRLPEEKERGITIDLGFANLNIGDVELGIVDVPGHEGFIRNMLAGATGMDAVLFVVAADEGVMPQTREHLAIVDLLGVERGVIALTKADLVDAEWLQLVIDDVRATVQSGALASAPIVPVSAVNGTGLEMLRAAILDSTRSAQTRRSDDLFRMPIDRAFTVRGTGSVVTGTVWSGQLGRDDIVRVLPAGLQARVRAVQVHGRAVERAGAGMRAAFALAGIERSSLARGQTLVGGDGWSASHILTASVRVLSGTDWELRTRQRVRVHLGTAEILARVVTLEADCVAGGASGWIQLRLEQPAVARAGDRFVLRSYSPVTTIAGGSIAEVQASKRKSLSAQSAEQLQAIIAGRAADALRGAVRLAQWRGARIGELPLRTPLSPARVVETLSTVSDDVVLLGDVCFDKRIVTAARTQIMAAVQRFHEQRPLESGLELAQVRRVLPAAAPAQLAEYVLSEAFTAGALVRTGNAVALRGFAPTLSGKQQGLAERALALIREGDLAPPTVSELAKTMPDERDLAAVLRLLEQQGVLIAVAPDLYFDGEALLRAQRVVQHELSSEQELAASDFKRALPVSRKYLIPLLEYFDRTGVTARSGESRRVLPPSVPLTLGKTPVIR